MFLAVYLLYLIPEQGFGPWRPIDTARVVAAMYSRKVRHLDEVLSHLHFEDTLDPQLALDPQLKLIIGIFKLRLIRYLSGIGHPKRLHDNGFISEADFERGQHDPLVRVRSLLLTAAESALLPIEDNWRIEVRVISLV